MDASSETELRDRLDALEADNSSLRGAVDAAVNLLEIEAHEAGVRDGFESPDSYRKTKYGWAALASAQAETEAGRADLLASETALASCQEESRIEREKLQASEAALASLQAETTPERTSLPAREAAPASLPKRRMPAGRAASHDPKAGMSGHHARSADA